MAARYGDRVRQNSLPQHGHHEANNHQKGKSLSPIALSRRGGKFLKFGYTSSTEVHDPQKFKQKLQPFRAPVLTAVRLKLSPASLFSNPA